MKILIVDDSRAMQAIVRKALLQSNLGHLEITTAESGLVAYEMLQQHAPPDLILSDWHMPGMTGLELLQLVRQMGFTDVEFGFITTETQANRISEGYRNGASFVLNKPFKDEELTQKLKELIHRLEPAPSTTRQVVELGALQQVIRHRLKAVPFRLVEREMDASHLTPQNQLAFFRTDPTSAVTAVGVMDSRCIAMLSLGIQGARPLEARPLVEQGQPSKDMQQAMAPIWSDAAACIHTLTQGGLIFHNHSMVAKEFPKLLALFGAHKGQSCFRLDIPGYGSGRMAFFLV